MDADFVQEFKLEASKVKEVVSTTVIWTFISFVILLPIFPFDGRFFAGAGLLLFCIPGIVLWINYYKNDKDLSLRVNHTKRRIQFIKGDRKWLIPFSDLQVVVRHKGQFDENNYRGLPSFFYHHTELKLKDGRSFFYTDFTCKGLVFRGVPTESKLRLINYIRGSRIR